MTIGINVTYDIKDVNSLTIKDGSLNLSNSSIYINNSAGSSGQILQIGNDNKLGENVRDTHTLSLGTPSLGLTHLPPDQGTAPPPDGT